MTKIEYEDKVEELFQEYRGRLERFYERQTGRELTNPDIFDKKDIIGRWLFWLYFDRGFQQNGIEDYVDGVASGTNCEIKCNTYGFNEKSKVVIDKKKVDNVGDCGRIVFIYPDFANRTISKRQFLVKDIKKYGRLSAKGGKVDNVSCEDSDKLVYFVGHEYAEAEWTWTKKGRKS